MPESNVSPYIPLSHLRELWKHVKMLEARKTQVTYHDVWWWLVRQEIHRKVVEDLQLKLYRAVKLAEELVEQNERLKKSIGKEKAHGQEES